MFSINIEKFHHLCIGKLRSFYSVKKKSKISETEWKSDGLSSRDSTKSFH